MVESESDKPNIVQPIMNGIDAIDIALRRPYISLKIHPVNAPIGCTKNAQLAAITNFWESLEKNYLYQFEYLILPIHEAWEAVIRRVSFGFSFSFRPISDGITIEGNPSNRPLFSETKLFASAANVWNSHWSLHEP